MTNQLMTNYLTNMFDLKVRDLRFTNRAINGFIEIPVLVSMFFITAWNFVITNVNYWFSFYYGQFYATYYVMPPLLTRLRTGKSTLPTLDAIELAIRQWHEKPTTFHRLIYLSCVKQLVLEEIADKIRKTALYEQRQVFQFSEEDLIEDIASVEEHVCVFDESRVVLDTTSDSEIVTHFGVTSSIQTDATNNNEIVTHFEVQSGSRINFGLIHSFHINIVKNHADINAPIYDKCVEPATVIVPYISVFCGSVDNLTEQTQSLLDFIQQKLNDMPHCVVTDVDVDRSIYYLHSVTINVVDTFEHRGFDAISYVSHEIKSEELQCYTPLDIDSHLSAVVASKNLREQLKMHMRTNVTMEGDHAILENNGNIQIVCPHHVGSVDFVDAVVNNVFEVQSGDLSYQAFRLVCDMILFLYKCYALMLICRSILKLTPIFDYVLEKYSSACQYVNKRIDMCLVFINFDYKTRIMSFVETTNLTTIVNYFTSLDEASRNRLVELKVMCHVLYHLYSGNVSSAQEHLSYTFVTRPIDLNVLLLNGGLAAYQLIDQVHYSQVKVDNQYITVTADEYQRLCAESDRGNKITVNDVVHTLDPQAGNLDDVAACIGTLFGNWKLSGLEVKDIELANKQFAFLKNVKNDVSDKTKLITFLLRLALRTKCNFDPLDPEFQIYSDDLIETIKKIDAVMARQDTLFSDMSEMIKVIDLHDEAFKLNTHVRMASISGCLQRAFAKSYGEIHTLYLTTKQAMQGNKMRVEPVCVLLMGDPGSGKSRFIEYAMEVIGATRGCPFTPEQAYSLSCSPYWERYCRQTHVVGDDVFKSTDTKNLFVEAEKIIHMQNTAPYNLDMAFTGKGTNFFDSEFIWLSTNFNKGGSFKKTEFTVGLVDDRALKRRFTLVLERNEKSAANVENNTYYIAKCDVFPGEVGRVRSSQYIVELILRIRTLHERRFETAQADYAALRARHAPAQDDGLIHEQFVEQNGETPRKAPELSEWLLKIMPMHLLEWTESPNAHWYMFAAACVVGILTVPAIYNYFFGTFETQSPDRNTHYEEKWARGKPVRYQIDPEHNFGYGTVPMPVLNFGTQNGDLDFHACLKSTIASGVGLIEIVANDPRRGYNEYSQCFHLKDGLMITPAHSLLKYTAKDMQIVSCDLSIAGKKHSIEFPTRYFKVRGEDVFIFMLPSSVPRPISLYKFLIVGSKFAEILPTQEIYQIWIGFNSEVIIRNMNRIPWSGRVSYKVCDELLIMETKCAYYGDCKKGDSGSPAIVHTVDGPKIVGMHVGVTTSGSKVGVATLLCQEWVDQLFENMTTQSAQRIVLKIDKTVESNMANNLPFRTRLRKSPIYGWIGPPKNVPVHFMPFINSQGESIDPLTVAMAKLKQEHFISPETLHEDRIVEFLMNTYPPQEARVLTFEEALNGLPGRNTPSIVGSTSAGYPYSLHAKKGKNPYITMFDGKYVYQQEFLDQLIQYEQSLLRGQQIEVIWADTLKDETRPLEKVDAGKTRLFTSCPLHYLILVRKYMLDFVATVQNLAASHPISVGLDVHSLSWTQLYLRMSRFNGSIIAGDFKNYDGSVPAFVGRVVLKFINKWYAANDADAQVRALLFEHLWNGVRICGQSMYSTKDGNPSGNPITSIYNSLVNMVMCYIILTEDLKLLESEFDFVMYGDDNIISVARQGLRCSDFSPHFMRRFGMEYTHFSKVVGADPLDNMDTIRYLGRSFVRSLSVYRAPLELSTILEATYWVRGTDINHSAFMSTVASAFLELSHFPIDEFNIHTKAILKAIKASGLIAEHDFLQTRKKTWYDYHDSMYDHNKKIVFTLRAQYKDNLKNGVFVCQSGDFAHQMMRLHEYIYHQNNVCEAEEFGFECQSGESNQVPKSFVSVSESRNVQFTERAANDAPGSQAVQLGEYQDVAPVSHSAVSDEVLQEPNNSCNMETFDLDHVLNREFLIASVSWATSASSGSVLATHNFPQVLFNQQFISEKIDNFRFFRAGIRYTIRVVSNKFLYGRILVAYKPEAAVNEYSYTSVLSWSAYPHVLVSASSGEAAVFDVPFIYDRRALDLLEAQTDQMGTFKIVVMNPLIDISGTVSTANIMITAQFLDAEVFMPHDDMTAFEIQSGRGSESRLKSEKHSLSSIYNVSKVIDSGVKTAKLAAAYGYTAMSLAQPLASAAMIGLSKPRTMDMTSVMKVNPFSDINTGVGIDLTPTLGMDPENQISTKPNVAGMNIDELNFKQVCGTPVCTQIHSFGPTTSSLAIGEIRIGRCAGSMVNGNYADWISNLFTYVSGSRKFKIYFTASQFHSARIVLYLADASSDVNWQNCYHKIIDIQGDTEVEFTAPYVSSYVSSITSGDSSYFLLYATVLSWSQPDNALNTPIYANIYTSAADDIKFAGLREVEFFVTQSCPREDFSKSFEPFHPSMTGYTHENLVFGEEYTTLRQVIHRYSAVVATAQLPTPYQVDAYQGTGDVSNGVYIGFEMIGLIYKFWRGSKRVKVITTAQTPKSLYVVSNTGEPLKGGAVSSLANPVVEIELPYYSRRFYQFTNDVTTMRLFVGSATNNMFVMTAAGDDFSFHFLRPPPQGSFQNPTTVGFIQMKTFLDSA